MTSKEPNPDGLNIENPPEQVCLTETNLAMEVTGGELDVEGQPRTDSFKKKSVLMRQSTRLLRDRQPSEGAAGMAIAVCCSLLCSLIFLAILNCITIACIIIGIIFIKEQNCPGEPTLAPTLIAGGCLAIFLSYLQGRKDVQVAKEQENEPGVVVVQLTPPNKTCWDYMLQLLRFVKLIVLIYFVIIVYRLSPNVVYDEHSSPGPDGINYYCHPTLFLFSYWLLMITLIISGIIVSIAACFLCCGLVMAGRERGWCRK